MKYLSSKYVLPISSTTFNLAAEERAEDDFIRRKIFRRKKVYPATKPPSNFEEEEVVPVQNTVPQNGGYVRRKIIKPIQIAAPTFTTTTTELPRVIEGPAENALNRSQDDPRCKNCCTQCYQL